MSVLIKGMEMPTSCEDCPLGDTLHCQVLPSVPALWAEYTNAIREKRLHSDCPLVSVPPHGRLIEAEPIMKYIADGLNSGEFGNDQIKVLSEIQYAPTIIPAEEE